MYSGGLTGSYEGGLHVSLLQPFFYDVDPVVLVPPCPIGSSFYSAGAEMDLFMQQLCPPVRTRTSFIGGSAPARRCCFKEQH